MLGSNNFNSSFGQISEIPEEASNSFFAGTQHQSQLNSSAMQASPTNNNQSLQKQVKIDVMLTNMSEEDLE